MCPCSPCSRCLALALRRLHEARLDPELAEAQAVVGLELHLGPREERVVVAARVLQQVGGELLLERALVALEPLAVLRAEPHRVLVRDVDARDRRRAVGVHLLRELAGDLDRLDLRGEGAAKTPSTRFSIRASRFRRTLIVTLLGSRGPALQAPRGSPRGGRILGEMACSTARREARAGRSRAAAGAARASRCRRAASTATAMPAAATASVAFAPLGAVADGLEPRAPGPRTRSSRRSGPAPGAPGA